MSLYEMLRTRILTHGSAPTLATTLSGRLYAVSVPSPAQYPSAVIRVQSRRTGGVDDGRLGEEGEIEALVFDNPRSQLANAESIMNRFENALLHYHSTSQGSFTMRGLVTRDTMPAFEAPADRDVVQVRAVWRYTWWPSYRTPVAQP